MTQTTPVKLQTGNRCQKLDLMLILCPVLKRGVPSPVPVLAKISMIRYESEETFYCDQWTPFVPGQRPVLAGPCPLLQIGGSPIVDLTGDRDEGPQDMAEDPPEDASSQQASHDQNYQDSPGHSGLMALVPVMGHHCQQPEAPVALGPPALPHGLVPPRHRPPQSSSAHNCRTGQCGPSACAHGLSRGRK